MVGDNIKIANTIVITNNANKEHDFCEIFFKKIPTEIVELSWKNEDFFHSLGKISCKGRPMEKQKFITLDFLNISMNLI